MKQRKKNKTLVGNHFYLKKNTFHLFLGFMIAVLEQQVRENYEEELKNSRVDKSNIGNCVFGFN
jgi:hypothetical protein